MNVISFSLYGPKNTYTEGFLDNLRILDENPQLYPGWRVLLYTSNVEVGELNRERGGLTIFMNEPQENEGRIGTTWRFGAAAYSEVDFAVFRDTDSRISYKEWFAVEEWVSSGKHAHVMHDSHMQLRWPILSGMFGLRGGVVPNMIELIGEWKKDRGFVQRFSEQVFLESVIYPRISGSVLHHSSEPTAWGDEVAFPDPDAPVHGFIGRKQELLEGFQIDQLVHHLEHVVETEPHRPPVEILPCNGATARYLLAAIRAKKTPSWGGG